MNEMLYWYRERGLLDSNTYVIKGDVTMLIDPGLRKYAESKANEMRNDGVNPEEIDVIAVTHLHPDHCDAVLWFKERFSAEIALHPSQEEHKYVLKAVSDFLRTSLSESVREFDADAVIESSLRICEGEEVRVLHTPGHSPESVCFFVPLCSALICGDLLFYRGVGRTDLPFGDESALLSSIERVRRLDAEILMPGHGEILKSREEVRRNFEFVRSFFF